MLVAGSTNTSNQKSVVRKKWFCNKTIWPKYGIWPKLTGFPSEFSSSRLLPQRPSNSWGTGWASDWGATVSWVSRSSICWGMWEPPTLFVRGSAVCRPGRGSCACCTPTTWSTSAAAPAPASASASSSSGTEDGTAPPWTTPPSSALSSQYVSQIHLKSYFY